jgi:mRNA export factor
MFGGGTTSFGNTMNFGQNKPVGTTLGMTPTAPVTQDFEVASPPDDSTSCLEFSPPTIPQIFLIAGSWDNNVSFWLRVLPVSVECRGDI